MRLKTKHIIWAIDLDSTINHSQKSGRPNQDVIDKVNKLQKDSDNYVVIYTARSEQYKDNVIHWLRTHKVCYDELRFGKLKADVFVDDKAVNPHEVKEWDRVR